MARVPDEVLERLKREVSVARHRNPCAHGTRPPDRGRSMVPGVGRKVSYPVRRVGGMTLVADPPGSSGTPSGGPSGRGPQERAWDAASAEAAAVMGTVNVAMFG